MPKVRCSSPDTGWRNHNAVLEVGGERPATVFLFPGGGGGFGKVENGRAAGNNFLVRSAPYFGQRVQCRHLRTTQRFRRTRLRRPNQRYPHDGRSAGARLCEEAKPGAGLDSRHQPRNDLSHGNCHPLAGYGAGRPRTDFQCGELQEGWCHFHNRKTAIRIPGSWVTSAGLSAGDAL